MLNAHTHPSSFYYNDKLNKDLTSRQTERLDVGLIAEEVYFQYGTRVYGLAMRMLGNVSDAEDITQEVLLQVIRRLDTFRGDAALTTWLYRVTVNAVLALRRRRATARERQYADDGHEFGGGPSRVPVAPPEEEILGGELRARLDAAMALLPDMYRDPFVLSDVEGMSNAAICEALGLSLPAVKSRLHRARLLMREALQPYFAERYQYS
jgi:RNA polymerase sigma-70 factor (ECF subfamily)